MMERTDDEIKAQIESMWPNIDDWSNACPKIVRGRGYIDLTVTKMYNWSPEEVPKLTFEAIDTLAKFFDTLKVELEEEIYEGGCETCDYGSRYGFMVRISDGAPYSALNTGTE